VLVVTPLVDADVVVADADVVEAVEVAMSAVVLDAAMLNTGVVDASVGVLVLNCCVTIDDVAVVLAGVAISVGDEDATGTDEVAATCAKTMPALKQAKTMPIPVN